MAGRFIDFDAARAERHNEPIRLKAYGREFNLPASMPASLMLDVMRLQSDESADHVVTVEETLGLLRRVLPPGVLEELLTVDEFSFDDFGDLLTIVMDAYISGDSGESAAPNRATRRKKTPAKSTRPRGSRAGSTGRREATTGTPSSSSGTSSKST